MKSPAAIAQMAFGSFYNDTEWHVAILQAWEVYQCQMHIFAVTKSNFLHVCALVRSCVRACVPVCLSMCGILLRHNTVTGTKNMISDLVAFVCLGL